MTKISKIVAAASVLGVLGVAILPVAGYAVTSSDTVTVEVNVGGVFSVADSGSDGKLATSHTGAPSIQKDFQDIVVTDNNAGTHSLYVGVENASLSGTDLAIGSAASGIPGAASLTAGTAGWNYGYAEGAGETTLTYVAPVKYTDSSNTAGGTAITTAGSVTDSLASYTIGSQSSVATVTPSGVYDNNLVIYATEN